MATMVGRDQELAVILRCLDGPDVALTLVTGEAGIGKSRLVAETVAATPNRLTLAGSCLPMRHSLPLGPISDALDTLDPTGRRVLARVVRSLPGSLRPHIAGVMPRTLPEEIEPAEEVRREQVFIATEALLSRVAEERPVTLVVEDVHWADTDTLDLLTYLAGARHHVGLRLLITCRAEEAQMPERVREWLDTQRRSAGVHELRLEPLDAGDVRRLVAGLPRPDGTDVERLAATVYIRSGGNPFFIEQLVASATDGERIPGRLAQLLSTRVRAVSSFAQDALTALAVLGRPVPVAALRIATGQDEVTCLAAVSELDAASLVVRDDLGVRPGHALLAEALLEALPGLPAAYHRRVAAALASLEDPSSTPEIAEHLHQAGDEEAELRMAQLAAQRAWDVGAYADAARWYQRSRDLHGRYPDEPLILAEPEMERRGLRALDLAGGLREAAARAEGCLGYYGDWPDPGERLSLLSYCAILVGIEDPDRGARILKDLLPQYEALSPSGDHANVLLRISAAQMARGDSQTALAFAEQALGVARAADDLEREALALARLSWCLRQLGDRMAADRFAVEAIRTAEQSTDDVALLDALITESDNRLKYAEYEAAAAAGLRGIEVADRKGLLHSFQAQLLLSNAAEAHLALGRTEEVAHLVDAVTDHPLRDDDDKLSWLRAHADLRRGDPRRALERLHSTRGVTPHGADSTRMDAETLAYMLLWNRQPAEAFEVVTNSLPEVVVGDHSQDAGLLLSLGARAAADLAQPDREPTAQAMASLDEFLGNMAMDPFADRATLPRASADRRQWQAERTRTTNRSEPEAWAEAASLWESLSMPHDAAYCWWRAAEALLADGASRTDVRSALHAAQRLSDGHIPLRGEVAKVAASARIPIHEASDIDDTPARERGLTEQEIKVLRLLTGGLTNAEIGVSLFISPKTVSVHVSNVLRKLEVSNRTEAATWAIHHGLAADA